MAVTERDPKTRRVAALGVLAALAAFVVFVISLHVLRPDVDPVRDDLSIYSVGPYSYLLKGAFIALGSAVFAVGWALMGARRADGRRRLGPIILMLSGTAAIAGAAFPTTAVTPVTPVDYAEVIASLTFFIGFAVGSGAVSFQLGPGWRRRAAILTSFGFDACFLVMLFVPDAVHGLVMRCAVSFIVAWVTLQGLFLLSGRQRL